MVAAAQPRTEGTLRRGRCAQQYLVRRSTAASEPTFLQSPHVHQRFLLSPRLFLLSGSSLSLGNQPGRERRQGLAQSAFKFLHRCRLVAMELVDQPLLLKLAKDDELHVWLGVERLQEGEGTAGGSDRLLVGWSELGCLHWLLLRSRFAHTIGLLDSAYGLELVPDLAEVRM